MKHWYKILVYAGLEPEEYRACLPAVRADNREKLRVYLATSSVLMFLAALAANMIPVMQPVGTVYGMGFLVCLALLGIAWLSSGNDRILLWMLYAFAAVLYTVGIASALSMPDELSVSFVAFSLAVPMLFALRPIQHIGNVLFFDLIFLVLVAQFETGMRRTIDTVDTIAFGIVSCIISTYVMLSKYQNFAAQERLRQMAHTDLLTGCKNRNAFERDRDLMGGGYCPGGHLCVC